MRSISCAIALQSWLTELRVVSADDIRSQVVGRCMAGANSPLSSATLGLQKFAQAGIPARQLILGIPWCVISPLSSTLRTHQHSTCSDLNDARLDSKIKREPFARCRQHLCAWCRRYGYGYSCLEGEPGAASLANPTSPFCVIKQVPFRGVACSDAAGGEMAYVSLMRLVDGGNTTSGVQWDESTGSNCTRNQSLLECPVRCLSSR